MENNKIIRKPNTQYVLSLSYGKDSMACLGAIKLLRLPLDRIVTAEVWATDTISADLPPMLEFKKYADKVIFEMFGIKVEHFSATRGGQLIHTKNNFTVKYLKRGTKRTKYFQEKSRNRLQAFHLKLVHGAIQDLKCPRLTKSKLTYEDMFYKKIEKPKRKKVIVWGCCKKQEKHTVFRYKLLHIARKPSKETLSTRIYGFPITKGNWCTRLKTDIFKYARYCGQNKYSTVSRNCRR